MRSCTVVDRSRRIKWTDEEVVVYWRLNQNARLTAEELGIGQTTVLRILQKAGAMSVLRVE